jgi:putative membrane protein
VGAVALRLLRTAPLFAAGPARAHGVDAASAWSFEPWVLACLFVSLAAYTLGISRLWRHAGRGRGIGVATALGFVAGWGVVAAALVSPLDELGSRLFSAHMLQHVLLMVVAAPLMVLGRPLAAWAWALPRAARHAFGAGFRHPAWRTPWRLLTSPLAAWVLHAAALWLWHLPAWFEAALAGNTVHGWQHASFLASALLFWWTVLGPARRDRQGVALLSLFTTMLHSGALGALLALSPIVWYPNYIDSAAALGWEPLEDQQLGGLLMWAPAGLAYLIAALVQAARWLQPAGVPRSSSIA